MEPPSENNPSPFADTARTVKSTLRSHIQVTKDVSNDLLDDFLGRMLLFEEQHSRELKIAAVKQMDLDMANLAVSVSAARMRFMRTILVQARTAVATATAEADGAGDTL